MVQQGSAGDGQVGEQALAAPAGRTARVLTGGDAKWGGERLLDLQASDRRGEARSGDREHRDMVELVVADLEVEGLAGVGAQRPFHLLPDREAGLDQALRPFVDWACGAPRGTDGIRCSDAG